LVKFSEQIKERIERLETSPTLSRTDKRLAIIEKDKLAKELQRRKKIFEETEEKVKGMTFEEYEKAYPKFEKWLQDSFRPPHLIRAEIEAQKQERLNKTISEVEEHEEEKQIAESDLKNLIREFNKLSPEQRQKRQKQFEKDKLKVQEEINKQDFYLKFWKEGKAKVQEGYRYVDIKQWIKARVNLELAEREAEREAERKSKEAYDKLLKESPFASTFKEYQKEIKGIDWADPRNVKRILEERFIETQGAERFIEQKTKGFTKTEKETREGDKVIFFRRGTKQFQIIKSAVGGKVVFREKGKGVRGTYEFIEAPREIITEEVPVPEELPILEIPSEAIEEIKTPKIELPDAEQIDKDVEKGIKKKRKWGITTSLSVLGIPIPKLVTKANPHFPVRDTDMLVRAKGSPARITGAVTGATAIREVSSPEFRKELATESGKALKRVFVEQPKQLYTQYKERKAEEKAELKKIEEFEAQEKKTLKDIEFKGQKIKAPTLYEQYKGSATTIPYEDWKKQELKRRELTKKEIEQKEKVPYDLTSYKLYYNKEQNKMIYFPKEQKEISAGFEKVDRLAYNPETDKFRALKYGDRPYNL